MDGQIVTKNQFTIIGKRIEAPISKLGVEVPQAQFEVRNRHQEIQLRVNPNVILGIGPLQNITENPEIHTIYVCTEVEDIVSVPDGMVDLTLPEQTYALFTYRGPMVDCWKAYGEIFDWIEKSGYQLDSNAYCIEYYGKDHNWEDKQTADNELDIYIPIK